MSLKMAEKRLIMTKGIDVSHNNGRLNWNEIKDSGIEFAIIRCGYGSDVPEQDDSEYEYNVSECERLDIPYGIYLYSYALDMNELQSEIAHVERLLGNKKPQLGISFDMEDADGYKAKNGLNVYESGNLLTNMCNTFCQYFADSGYKSFVYASYDYFANVLGEIDHLKWLAHWSIPEPSMSCAIWQYTSDGVVNGSSARTDMNYCYIDIPKKEVTQEPTRPTEPIIDNKGINVGDKVRILVNATYNGGSFVMYYDTYDVIQINGDRVVIGIGDTVTCAINICNIEKVGTSKTEPQPQEEIPFSLNVGNKVRFIGELDYQGTHIKAWHNDEGYIVKEITDDRVVLEYNGVIFAAVHINDVEIM